MKTTITFLLALIFASGVFAQDKAETLKTFLSGVMTINPATLDKGEPLISVAALADSLADQSMQLTKDNIGEALKEAANYANTIIIVHPHTIVRITDLNDCRQSGAWKTCMPMGKGYIQKQGTLHEKQDYINNIIGVPDGQSRTIYFFK